MKQYQMGVLGAGNMGTAIADGAVRAGMMAASSILMFNRTADKRAQKAAAGYAVTGAYPEVYTQCAWVILGVKPQNMDELLPHLAQTKLSDKPLLISIAAGVTFAKLEAALGADQPIVRVMPNTPLMLGLGASALVGNAAASPAQVEAVRGLFAAMGSAIVFSTENALNDIIPYNGSLPAYIYAFIEAMTQSAMHHGIDRASALSLICQTCIGAAEMVRQGDKTPAELIAAVCSPGGTTIEAVRVLDSRNFAGILAEASDECIARAYELGT